MDIQIAPEQFQTSNRVLMIRPSRFGYHAQAASSNAFMHNAASDELEIAQQAVVEFDGLVNALKAAGIEVLVYQDTDDLPDCVFPNNWVSWHTPSEGEAVVVTYPMCDHLRRAERRAAVLETLAQDAGPVGHIDLAGLEESDEILEGTGSLVLDRVRGKAFACLSARTTMGALDAWCDETGYAPIAFRAVDQQGQAIYHTNVIMSVGDRVAVMCLDSIPDPEERLSVLDALRVDGREVLEISYSQMSNFCGNILELTDQQEKTVYAMSTRAYEGFTDDQRAVLRASGTIVHAPIPTIEDIGGGSVRCMIAEAGRVGHS